MYYYFCKRGIEGEEDWQGLEQKEELEEEDADQAESDQIESFQARELLAEYLKIFWD